MIILQHYIVLNNLLILFSSFFFSKPDGQNNARADFCQKENLQTSVSLEAFVVLFPTSLKL